MRTLFLLRGTPASGKSTWVKENNLSQYTLSADQVRLQIQSPVLNLDGDFIITQKNDGVVWNTLFSLLEKRMERGEFVVVDATHYRTELIQRYKDLIKKYRYRAYIIDFTNVPLNICLERNRQRDKFKRVPDGVIEKMYAVFEAEKDGVFKEISNKYKVLPYDKALDILQEDLLYDLNDKFSKVVVFGDVHGCYEPLKQYFDENPIQDDVEYIFTGDYIDRGIQNKEVLNFIYDNLKRPNFMFLEGNHELHLRKWCSENYKEVSLTDEEKKIIKKVMDKNALKNIYDNNIRSTEFKNNTIPQIQDMDKGVLRQVCRKFAQFTYFKLGNKKYFVSHGGLPCVPNLFISAEEMIRGVGKYEELDNIYESWEKNTDEDTFQIHAHRNIFDLPIVNECRCINLCDAPELGKNLRVVEIDKSGNFKPIYIKNEVYNKECKKVDEKVNKIQTKTDNKFLQNLNESKWVQKKALSNGIVSYNFTRDAFYKQHWDEITCKARGLFVDKDSEQVVALGYNKFFSWGQGEEYSSNALKHNLKFPVKAYRKENGFLALITYLHKTGELMFCSKSTNSGEYVEYIKDTFYNTLDKNQQDFITEYCKENNCTMIFECIRPVEDPHIIRYCENKLILLDIVSNSFEPQFVDYNDMKEMCVKHDIPCKYLEWTFTDFDELHKFKKEVVDEWGYTHEGYVLEDADGFKVKLKSRYYTFWKKWRGVKESMQKGNNIKRVFTDKNDVLVYKILSSYTQDELKQKSIIDISDDFYREYINIVDKYDIV